MKQKRTGIFTKAAAAGLLAASLLGSGASAFCFSVEVKNIGNNQPSRNIVFGTMGPTDRYGNAQQYVLLSYPHDDIKRDFRFYSSNPRPPKPGAFYEGLVSADRKHSVPLYWENFPSARNGVVFSSSTETAWEKVIDIYDPNFKQKKDQTLVPENDGGKTFLYYGVKLASGTPSGVYRTRLIFESVNRVSDHGRPICRHTPRKRIHFGKKALVFLCIIDEDVQITNAQCFYRYKGESQYSSVEANLTQNPENPFQWSAEGVLPADKVKKGALQYYFQASDGYEDGVSATDVVPHETEILDDMDEVAENIPAEGGSVGIFDGDSRYGMTSLELPPGSIEKGVMISAKKLNPTVFPQKNGKSPLTACDFHPEKPLRFNKSAQLTIKYDDEDADGTVDGTNAKVKDLKIYWWDNFQWRYVGGKIDEAKRTVKAPLTHLSTFALMPSAEAGDWLPKEKIITPALQDGINDSAVFDGLDSIGEPFEITILDVTGRKVRVLHNFGKWDGRDNSGNLAESGVYIYQIHAQGRILTGTITVAK